MCSTCCPRSRGFTLLESLITVLMVMLVFGLVADLLLGAFRITRTEREKMQAAEAGQVALQRMTCELREACRLETTLPANEVTFYKFNASRTADARSEANRYQYVLKIRYYLDAQGTLLRDVQENSGAPMTHVVADNIRGILVEPSSESQNVVVTLSVEVRGKLRRLVSEVALLGVP